MSGEVCWCHCYSSCLLSDDPDLVDRGGTTGEVNLTRNFRLGIVLSDTTPPAFDVGATSLLTACRYLETFMLLYPTTSRADRLRSR